MKIVCTRNNLRDAFQLAERFTGKNFTLPVLANIFFSAEGNEVRCVATNLEMGVEVSIPGKILKAGAITVPGRIMNTLMQSIDEETVVIEEKDASLAIKTDSSNFVLQGIDPKDFPMLPKIKQDHEFSVSAADLKKAFGQVLPASATSEFKPELAGIFLGCHGRTITLAATDSFRLAEKTIPLFSVNEAVSLILPGRTCQELLRILPESDEKVVVHEGEHQVRFDFSSIRIVSRLIDGTYPDYAAIIPKEFAAHLSVGRDELIRKVKAASVLSSKLNDIAVVSANGESFVEAANAELGKSRIQLSAKTKGKESRVSFNFRYLLDGLEALSGEEAILSTNGDSAPAMIRDPNDSSFRYVLMPIRSV